jgi:chaperonin GroES
MISLEPIADRVVLKSVGGSYEVGEHKILIAESCKQQFVKAQVVAVGPGRMLESGLRVVPQVKIGDIVLVNSLACAPSDLPVEMEGDYFLIPERDIAAIIHEE